MSHEDKLDDLLVQWGEARERGEHLSVEDLCADCPELVAQLTERISGIEFARPFIDLDDDSACDFLHLPDFSTVNNRAGDTRLPASGITLDQFCQRLVESGLMDDEQVANLRKTDSSASAVAFAQQLVSSKKLTHFQATVLLEGRDLPLVLDRYVMLDEIGAGGMGAVYKALHQQMDRIVALKILPKSAVDSPEKVKRFQREVKAAAKLEHQNIVVAHDATESKGTHFLVMSYVDGQDLAKLVRKNGPFSVAKAVHYIAQAARGLEHAHGMGIVHRDIKPANLLLNKKGIVKILDMGLARIESTEPETEQTVSAELTQDGMVMGTIAYLAPEQALDTRNADARSDMYSLGCTLFYLLTGKVPYHEDTMMKTIFAHREGAIPSLSDERAGVPVELDAIFQKMVAKQPEDRFRSMTEVVSALEKLDIKDEECSQPIVAGSQAYHDTATFIDTSQECINPIATNLGGKKLTKRFWGITACLIGFLGVLWAASISLKVETSAGTILLEIDQPELAGAEVSVDGHKKITIKTGDGTEPIQVEADENTHTLKVTKGGFESFVKKFTVKAGKEQTIKVRLEPMKSEKPQPTMPKSTGPNWALEFDGTSSEVFFPSFQYDGTHSITIECWATAFKRPNENNEQFVLSMRSQPMLVIAREVYFASGYLPGRTQEYRLSADKRLVDECVHVAVVYHERMLQLFINGKGIKNSLQFHLKNSKEWLKVEDDLLPGPFPLASTKATGLSIGAVDPSADESVRESSRFKGMIDEVRISNIVRYDKDFTPANRFESDEHTMALYHFDEGEGNVLKDVSGNEHHGKIVNAKWVKVKE